ncbi:MAG: biotin--[acetyl-CoA-carboxylase] ligase [Myxococcales bacterium]|nr:biotin--[acetyl-CoA-carboxylase] ligase [Myxococcales bacterium]
MSTEAVGLSNEELILSFLVEGGEEFTSGEALSDKLGLSRAAVWKVVESLRRMGYRIDAAPARGYRLVEIPDRLTALELTPLLSTHDIGRTIHYFDSLRSTSETAKRLAVEGAFHGEVVIADQQTEGRGRRGRRWESPAGLNLYFSVVLRPELPPQRAPELTLLAAVAVAESLRDSGVKAEIKWPNDLHVEGKKIGGILTELTADPDRVQHVILGIGVNLNAQERDFPDELRQSATSVFLARGQRVPRALFTAALWTRLEQWLDLYSEQGFGLVRDAWRKLSSTLGREVLVKAERRELRGVAEDVDEAGALVVRLGDGTVERVLAGDVEQVRSRR